MTIELDGHADVNSRAAARPRLLALTASHSAQLLDVSDLAAPFQMTRQTVHDYVTVLERVFLVDRLPLYTATA
jgi:predicted AAA+ superfamily ATPase